jgi:ABC-2 type transport system ATP-binding protein
VIEAVQLTKHFGQLVAVDHLNIRVEPGELFGFLGPNGAGKTTTIKMLCGLLRPSEGTAHIGEYDVLKQSHQARSSLGYVPDNPFLYEKLTGREYLHFMADLYSVRSKELNHKIEDLLHLFELSEKGNELIESYSRGMRQKIAMAGALIHEPQALFLDEPTVGLDPRSARLMKDILRGLCERGVAVFVSTHILEVAERMCDRVGIINQGKLLVQGTLEELRDRKSWESATLEDIFLDLTGGPEHADLIRYLGS